MQKRLDQLDWEPEPDPESVEEWVKLEVGDIIWGVLDTQYKDDTFGKNNYIFKDAVVKRKGKKEKDTYKRIGMNGSYDLDRKIKGKEDGTPLMIERLEDIQVDRPNPMKAYRISRIKSDG